MYAMKCFSSHSKKKVWGCHHEYRCRKFRPYYFANSHHTCSGPFCLWPLAADVRLLSAQGPTATTIYSQPNLALKFEPFTYHPVHGHIFANSESPLLGLSFRCWGTLPQNPKRPGSGPWDTPQGSRVGGPQPRSWGFFWTRGTGNGGTQQH